MKISDEKVVSITYLLEVEGAERDRADREHPLEFICGLGYLLPKFEENLKDKEPGDSFSFVLSPEEGYGVYDEKAVVDLPMHIFEVDGTIREGLLEAGNTVPMMTQDGRVIPGKVLEVAKESVKMDFNHELAGKELHFTGEVIAVREATEKELTEGLHGERAAHNCGGSCSECGGGCH